MKSKQKRVKEKEGFLMLEALSQEHYTGGKQFINIRAGITGICEVEIVSLYEFSG